MTKRTPSGDDKLWFHPDPSPIPHDYELNIRMWHCPRCDVTWKEYWNIHNKRRIKCWNCGRFQKYPNI